MRARAWIGVDLGTSSLKVLTVGVDGVLLDQREAALPVDRQGTHRVEADPRVWTRAVDDALLPLRATYDVRAVGVTGQMHGTVLVDEQCVPVRPAVLWPDSRSRSLRGRWSDLPPRVLARLGNPWSPGMTGPVLAWLAEHEADSVERARRVILPKDFVRAHLVAASTLTDPSDASGTLLWDVVGGAWATETEDLVPARLLPEVAPSAALAGTWGAADVHVGGGDTPVSLVALERAIGSWEAGDLVVNLGTGAQVIEPLAEPPSGAGWPGVHTYAGALGGHYAMVAAQNAGLALSWAQERLGVDWERLVALAGSVPAGAGGVVFSPFVAPERGALHSAAPPGWTPERPDPAPAARAAAEAQAFLVRRSWDLLGAEGRRVFLVGGGAREPWVRQLLADVLDRPVQHVPLRSAAAAGAVLLANGPLPEELSGPGTTTRPRSEEALEEGYRRWLAHCYPPEGLPDADAAATRH